MQTPSVAPSLEIQAREVVEILSNSKHPYHVSYIGKFNDFLYGSSFSQIRDTCTGQYFLEILSDEFRVTELCMVLEGKIKKMPNSTTRTVALKAVEMLEHGQLKDIIDATKIRVDSMVESEAQASKTRNRKALVIGLGIASILAILFEVF